MTFLFFSLLFSVFYERTPSPFFFLTFESAAVFLLSHLHSELGCNIKMQRNCSYLVAALFVVATFQTLKVEANRKSKSNLFSRDENSQRHNETETARRKGKRNQCKITFYNY